MRRSIAFGVFFASGFAALTYQVIWQRLLVFFSGADVYAVTIIVAAFMAGLGIGNLVGGHVADRLSARLNLVMFVVAELAIALFAFFSKAFFYDFLYQRHSDIGRSPVVLSTVLLISLLWPTFFMGVSLPLLAKALSSDVRAAASVIGGLYSVNTLGAGVGAIVTTWVLLPLLGLENSLRASVILNFGCAVIVTFLVLAVRDEIGPTSVAVAASFTAREGEQATIETRRFGFGTWLLLYCLSGFIALSLEILWFRLVGVILKSTAFTFGTLLGFYLGGLGLGALGGTIYVKRNSRPISIFLALQAFVGVYAAVSIAVATSPLITSIFPTLSSYLSDTGETHHFGMLYVLVPAFLITPATFLMGLSFPYLQKAVQHDPAKIGRRLGTLQLANIVGGVFGTILTGLLCLNVFGTSLTLKLITALAAVFGIIWWQAVSRFTRLRKVTIAFSIVALATAFAVLPGSETLWARLHGTDRSRVIVDEDGTGVSVARSDTARFQGSTRLFVNGLSQSWIPYGGIHTELGALPVFLHPKPRDIAVIGLGSGDTLFGIGGRADVRSIVCIEIVHPQLETLRRLALVQPDPGLSMLLEDSRVHYVSGDGRAYIMRSDAHYDIIEADALRPFSAYAGNLYSREYFELLKAHLKPGGFAVTWTPTTRVRNTLLSVFPFVVSCGNVAIGSSQPIPFAPSIIWSRINETAVRDYYSRAGINIQGLLEPWLTSKALVYGPDAKRSDPGGLNTDLFPRDEFARRRLPAPLKAADRSKKGR